MKRIKKPSKISKIEYKTNGMVNYTRNIETEEIIYELWEFEGIPYDGDDIVFTINIAPSALEDVTEPKDAIVTLGSHIHFLNKLRFFIMILSQGDQKVGIEGDFYWGEGDLNFRITISDKHPLFQNLK